MLFLNFEFEEDRLLMVLNSIVIHNRLIKMIDFSYCFKLNLELISIRKVFTIAYDDIFEEVLEFGLTYPYPRLIKFIKMRFNYSQISTVFVILPFAYYIRAIQ